MTAGVVLVGADRVLEGADLAQLDRWADRRAVGPWWRRLVAGLGPGVTVGQLLEHAEQRRQRRALEPFLLGHGLLRVVPADDQGEGPGPSSRGGEE